MSRADRFWLLMLAGVLVGFLVGLASAPGSLFPVEYVELVPAVELHKPGFVES